MAAKLMASVIEHCKISPPPDATTELSLPLTYFDMPWVEFRIMQTLDLYEFPHSKTHMVETIIPDLKSSLSLTLKHFLPLAGNLEFPPNSAKPFLHYVVGNSVSVTFAESSHDFDYLKGFHARNSKDFYHLLPLVPPPTKVSDSTLAPLLAIQVTIFPNFGISIGITVRHVACDASTGVGFIKAWGSINKLGRDVELQAHKALTFLDRGVIEDSYALGEIFWNELKGNIQLDGDYLQFQSLVSSKVRATFVVNQVDIKKLKNQILQNVQTPVHTSAFTAICAYAWTCRVKSRSAIRDQKVEDDELEYFVFFMDCRPRLKPPIPINYFGNCIAPCLLKAKHAKLASDEGFLYAARLIGEAIDERLNSEEGVLKDVKAWVKELKSINLNHLFGVSGSPKFDTYEVDFGWGKPEKCEIIATDKVGMSLSKSRKSEGGLEVGLSLSETEMDAFARFLTDGLQTI